MLYLLGIYSYVRVPLGVDLVLPATVAGLAGLALLLLNVGGIRRRHVVPLAAFAAMAAASILLAPQPGPFLVPRAKGWVLLIYSMGSAYGFCLEALRWPRRALAQLLLAVTVLLIVGCFLENYAGLRHLSDAFRNAVFARGVYDGDARDLMHVGMIRPKLFTSEPSHVAKFFVLSATSWLMVSTHRKKYLMYSLLALSALFLIRSPIAILAAFSGLAVRLLGPGEPRPSRKLSSRLGTMAFAVAAAVLVGLALGFVLRDRVAMLRAGGDPSSVIRIVGPAVVARATLAKGPWFGAGISGMESVLPDTVAQLVAVGIRESFLEDKAEDIVQNAFWLHWIYYGLLGGSVGVYLLFRFMKSVGVRHVMLCTAVVLIYSQTMGGPHAPRFWAFMVLTFVAAACTDRSLAAARPPARLRPMGSAQPEPVRRGR